MRITSGGARSQRTHMLIYATGCPGPAHAATEYMWLHWQSPVRLWLLLR